MSPPVWRNDRSELLALIGSKGPASRWPAPRRGHLSRSGRGQMRWQSLPSGSADNVDLVEVGRVGGWVGQLDCVVASRKLQRDGHVPRRGKAAGRQEGQQLRRAAVDG